MARLKTATVGDHFVTVIPWLDHGIRFRKVVYQPNLGRRAFWIPWSSHGMTLVVVTDDAVVVTNTGGGDQEDGGDVDQGNKYMLAQN